MTKPIISPAQALLILIDSHRADLVKTAALKKMYLTGDRPFGGQGINKLLHNHPALADYQVSYEISIINNDPTRRYFETHLAYETLLANLHKINKTDLDYHCNQLSNLLGDNHTDEIDHVLEGFVQMDADELAMEYGSFIAKLQMNMIFKDVDTDDKILMLVRCSYLAVLNTQYTPLPLDIYGVGLYTPENKGKILTDAQSTTRNMHMGLMKGHMPLAVNDIAHSSRVFPLLKPSDQATYDAEAIWVKANFCKLVHPFSNSISGTTLAQLRTHIKFKNAGESVFTKSLEKFSVYMQLSIAAMLYYSGGHSLYEFIFPLSLDAVQGRYSFMKGFSDISLESMFLTNNEPAFTKAINAAVEYNNSILIRAKLHIEMRARFTLPTPAVTMEADHEALTVLELDQNPAVLVPGPVQATVAQAPVEIAAVKAASSRNKRNFFFTQDENTQTNNQGRKNGGEEGDEKRARKGVERSLSMDSRSRQAQPQSKCCRA